jgi:hypothetical protein
MAIMIDLMPMMRALYLHYFEQETMVYSKSKDNLKDLKRLSLEACFSFLKDFEFSPQNLHRKTCFAVWFSVVEASASQHAVHLLCNNTEQTRILPHNLGKQFTLAHFVIFFFRICILNFDHTADKKYQTFNLVRKFIYQLRELERGRPFV